jgi:thiosulfate reductase cytochrome b subunit
MADKKKEFHHPLIIRFTHWINFVALGIMVTSGLQIYNASPILSFEFPSFMTLGGWLAGARMWHFFAMWILFLNGIIWVVYNIVTRHGRLTTIFRKEDIPGVLPMIQYYIRVRKEHPPVKKYNSLQKLAYSSVALLGIGSVMTGIAIYWPVQFGFVTAVFGGYNAARAWHFFFMLSIVFFFFGHIFMVGISGWSNFVSIITGWKRISDKPDLSH